MEIIDLGGHSGCKIMLYQNNKNVKFVRKVSSSKKYNERLKLQADKQRSFNNKYIKAPKVLAEGYTCDGLFYFDMEFIYGITISKYIENIEISKVKELAGEIINFIKSQKVLGGETNENIFKEKVKSLKEKLDNNNKTIKKSLNMLENHSWTNFENSNCHGDLTLENIMIKNDQLYLIDFLDSFYDCWILDISTILQDVELLWSYRYEKNLNINTILRLIVFKDVLINEIKKIDNLYIEVYYALLLKIIRIFPYAKDELTFNFLISKAEYVMDVIKEAEK